MSLKFEVHGIDGHADFEDFGKFASTLSEALRRTARNSEDVSAEPVQLQIAELGTGSAIAVIHGNSTGERTIQRLMEIFKEIRNRTKLSFRVSSDDIRLFKRLVPGSTSKTSKIILNDLEVSAKFGLDCDWYIANSPSSNGQMIGRLEGLNVHDRFVFRIYPEESNRGIECAYDESLFEQVRSLVKCRVRVEGIVHRDPDERGIDRISKVSRITHIPESSELPTMRSLIGILKTPKSEGIATIASDWE